jgi:hypothetical protein
MTGNKEDKALQGYYLPTPPNFAKGEKGGYFYRGLYKQPFSRIAIKKRVKKKCSEEVTA